MQIKSETQYGKNMFSDDFIERYFCSFLSEGDRKKNRKINKMKNEFEHEKQIR